jgi:hypothetical protein
MNNFHFVQKNTKLIQLKKKPIKVTILIYLLLLNIFIIGSRI